MKTTFLCIAIIAVSVWPSRNLKSNHIRQPHDTIPQVLYQMLPKLNEYANKDSIFYPYDSIQDADTSHVMAIGRFIDHKNLYAIDTSVKDSTITFYKYDAPEWKNAGKEKLPDFTWFRFNDLDGDGRNEILAETFWNMNGNVNFTIYYASAKSEKVHYAGNFFGRYELSADKKQLHYIYEGSYYADYVQALYEWRNEKLIPLRQVTISPKDVDRSNAEWIIYEENPTFDKDTLVVKFRKTYHEKNKKMHDLRENFFDTIQKP